MSGQNSRRTTMLSRIAIGLLTIAAALLLAPAATATPESDAANAAITAAWEASGGDAGPLGPRQGEVYPVGTGFALNCAGGKIFFTPATGAHFMQGAILEKYESLGGAADGDLGFPTIDEGPGRAPDSRNTTFSAADKPVIFWTPATGARVVRGAINAAWDKLGGSSGVLGVPADDETYRDDVLTQKFTGGELSYNMRDKTFSTVPPELAGQLEGLAVPDDPVSAINAARRAAGGPLGPLGAADGAPYKIGEDGLGQNFAGGKIFYSPATGANVVTGQVLAKYESVGGPEGDLGFPATDEVDGGLATTSRMTTFAAEDHPVIFWTPEHGAVIVRGPMKAAWDKLDAAKGALGAPVADQTEDGGVVTQRFTGGAISWDRSTGEFSTEPGNLASGLAGLEVPGQQAPAAPASPQASDSSDRKWFAWSWWWLLAIIPVVVLIALVAFATRHNRRRGDDEHLDFDDHRFDSGAGGDAEHAYSTAPESGTAGDDYAAAMFGDRYAREGLGALTPPSAAVPSAPANPWEAPRGDDEARDATGDADAFSDDVDTAPTRVPTAAEQEAAVEDRTAVEPDDAERDGADEWTGADEWAGAAAPETHTERETRPERDPLTDTGRHARIEIEEPDEARPAFRLSLDESGHAPEGYPIKADTQSGRYWAPGSAGYVDARAEIWFSSEEFAVTNGFVRGD